LWTAKSRTQPGIHGKFDNQFSLQVRNGKQDGLQIGKSIAAKKILKKIQKTKSTNVEMKLLMLLLLLLTTEHYQPVTTITHSKTLLKIENK